MALARKVVRTRPHGRWSAGVGHSVQGVRATVSKSCSALSLPASIRSRYFTPGCSGSGVAPFTRAACRGWTAVDQLFDRHGIGIGNQVPDRMRILVGLDLADGDDFERSELELAVEAKEDRIDRRLGLRALAAAKDAHCAPDASDDEFEYRRQQTSLY